MQANTLAIMLPGLIHGQPKGNQYMFILTYENIWLRACSSKAAGLELLSGLKLV